METNQSTEHYLINMTDGRRILFTKQAARQINYHPITREVAFAIDAGRITWQEVVSRIKANLINNQDAWDDLLKKKTTMNVRKSTLTPDDTEGMETAPDAEEVADEFKMDVGDKPDAPAADAPAPAKRGNSRRGGKKDAGEAAPDKGDKPDAPAPAADAPAPADGEPAGEDLGL